MSFNQERFFDFGFALAQNDSSMSCVILSGAIAQSKDLFIYMTMD